MCFESLCSLKFVRTIQCLPEWDSEFTDDCEQLQCNNTHNWRGLTWINSHRKALVIKPIKSYIFILLIEVTMVEASLSTFCFFPLPILWMRYVADSLKLIKHLNFLFTGSCFGRTLDWNSGSFAPGWMDRRNKWLQKKRTKSQDLPLTELMIWSSGPLKNTLMLLIFLERMCKTYFQTLQY